MLTTIQRSDIPDHSKSNAATPERKPWQPLKLRILEIGQHTRSDGGLLLFEDDISSPMS
jgi:hypothetical protein